MTRLTLLRHAKSTWEKKDVLDIERTLNGQGCTEAALMGQICQKRLPPPDLVLVSPARRTRETVALFLEVWKSAHPVIKTVEALYLAGLEDWKTVLGGQARETDHIMICSHQPGLGKFASWLCPGFRGDVPSATVISILLKNGNYGKNDGVLDFTGSPKSLNFSGST